jgi:predicted GNAT family acetyltransferase
MAAHGPEEDLRELLGEIREERMYLSVRPEVLKLLERAGYRIEEAHEMLRMALDPGRFRAPDGHTERLGLSDLEALRALYADGEPYGEAPPFFSEATLESGVYHGIREGTDLVAAAGTHVFTPAEDVAGIGNVYTRRDRRGRGLGGRVTAAVVSDLAARGTGTIALNVAPGNAPAVRVYERLGFRRYCLYFEGVACGNSAHDA